MRYTHFTKDERNELSILRMKGYSLRAIARVMRKSPSSVSRELGRNAVRGSYDPKKASHKAYVRRKYSKYQGMKIKERIELERYVIAKLMLRWSPEQIAGRWNRETKDNLHYSAIYKYLRSVYGFRYAKYLRRSRRWLSGRRARYVHRQSVARRVFIDARPAIVNYRRRIGDFEGDTLGVPKRSRETLAALLDRKSRYFLARRIARVGLAMNAFKEMAAITHPLTFTFDNGVENAGYEKLGVPTYFCHPFSSWEKGSLEHAFKLLREFIPKKSVLARYTDEEIDSFISLLNHRPRKCLNYEMPCEIFKGRSHSKECCT